VIVRIREAGGFAGASGPADTLDTSTLPPAKAARVKDRIAALRRHLASGSPPIGADLPEYQIDVVDEQGKTERLVLPHDPSEPLPEPLKALIEEVRGT